MCNFDVEKISKSKKAKEVAAAAPPFSDAS